MVGFNRRFAPAGATASRGAGGQVAARYLPRQRGAAPSSHWTHDPRGGGGRIVGEVCHFLDFAAYLCGGEPLVSRVDAVAGSSEPLEDNISATLRFPDGSIATIVYSALGDSSLEKERVEVFGEAGAGVLSDFSSLSLHRGGRASVVDRRRDKGHAREIATFLEACRTGTQPWPVRDMAAVTRATFALRDGVRSSAR